MHKTVIINASNKKLETNSIEIFIIEHLKKIATGYFISETRSWILCIRKFEICHHFQNHNNSIPSRKEVVNFNDMTPGIQNCVNEIK